MHEIIVENLCDANLFVLVLLFYYGLTIWELIILNTCMKHFNLILKTREYTYLYILYTYIALYII